MRGVRGRGVAVGTGIVFAFTLLPGPALAEMINLECKQLEVPAEARL